MKPDGGGERLLTDAYQDEGPTLVAQRPRHPVLPHRRRASRARSTCVGRPDRGRTSGRYDAARWIRSGLVAVVAVIELRLRIALVIERKCPMSNRAATVAMIAVLLGASACSTKKKALPPARRPPAHAAGSSGGRGQPAGRRHRHGRHPRVPGSVADFKATSGSDTVLFALRQLRRRRHGAGDPRQAGRVARALSATSRSPSRAIPTSAARANTTSRSATAARPRRRTSSPRRASSTSRHRDDQLRQGTPGRRRQRRERLGAEPPRGDGRRQRRALSGIATVAISRDEGRG